MYYSTNLSICKGLFGKKSIFLQKHTALEKNEKISENPLLFFEKFGIVYKHDISRKQYAPVAQWIEHRPPEPGVVRSTRITDILLFVGIDCKS